MKKLLLFAVLLAFFCAGCSAEIETPSAGQDFTSVPPGAGQTNDSIAAGEEYRAVWISYLEWQRLAGCDEAAFRENVAAMLQNCADLGLNTVIAQVRPFGDALYQSELFPQSHLLSGAQGQSPGYDPLAILIEEAHARDLELEAWINPYRVQLTENLPSQLADTNPALLHPDWVQQANGGLYYDPGLPEVRQLVVDGVKEIVANYDVDGIHFDDYFYPTTDASFDADTYAQYGQGMELADWRRDNVNQLVQQVYQAVKETDPAVRFGISPQGNNANNYDQQYSDVALWMSQPGYVDYVMPQLYWGFGYLTSSGRDDYQFSSLCRYWAGLERCSEVSLYIGLGGWRIGEGDGGSNDQAEWSSGHNLADMITDLRAAGCGGFALYRYDSLYASGWPELAAAELEAMASVLAPLE